jgi:lysylphosphatidylglycerol synthetase-like protein (DUF2156 family)
MEQTDKSMTGVALDIRVALLRHYGTFTQAYSATFQPELLHFGDEGGFVAYKIVGRTALVLSDPVAPQDNFRDLIGRFLQDYSDVGFWQISRPVAEILASHGFFINEIGPENRIDLERYDFTGREKRNLRNSLNRIVSSGHTIRESSIAEVGAERVRVVSEAWRRTHTVRSREVAFLSRPMVIGDELDVRTMFTFGPDGDLVAFAVYDPIYEAGQVVGYTAQHSRHHAHADSLVQTAMRRFAIEKFQAEGKKWLFLGLAPLALINDWDFQPHKNWLVRRSFRFAYENWFFNRFIYPLKAIHAHKRQFRGSTDQAYYAFNRTPSLPRIFKMLRACKVL